MSLFSYTGTYLATKFYRCAPYTVKQAITKHKIKKIVNYAKKSSEYYKSIIPENWKSIDDIPLTSKKKMMDNFDDVITDKRVKYSDVYDRVYKAHSAGKYLGKYALASTSGSTGQPAIIVQDNNFSDHDVISGSGHFFIPIATILFAGNNTITAERYKESQGRSKFISKNVKTFLMSDDTKEIIKGLNEYQPKTISGFPTVLDALFDHAQTGELKINPQYIFLSGEMVTPAIRRHITKLYPQARITSMYGCTEGGAIAYECKEGHLHINEDLVVLEPLNENGNVIQYEETADKIALTNLSNYVQPIIRYEINDIAVFHRHCTCGNRSPWIEINGRDNDVLTFKDRSGNDCRINGLQIGGMLDEISEDGFSNFGKYQLILHSNNRLEARIDFYDGINQEDIFGTVKNKLAEFFNAFNLDVEVYLSDKLPERTARGKFMFVKMAND